MLQLVLGRNYCNKTEYVRALVADRVNKGEAGFIIIVPEQFSYDTEKSMLEKVGSSGMQRLEVLSFSRLAELVLEQTGNRSDKQSVDKGVKMLTMSMALEGLSDRLNIFRKYASRPALTESIVSLATELKQCYVPVDKLSEYAETAEESALKDKLSELSLIISTYNAMLEQSYYDKDDALTQLSDVLCDYKYFNGKTVVFDEFTRFTKQEMGVLERIITQAKEVYVTFNTDPSLNNDAYPQFENINSQLFRLRDAAEKCGITVEKPIVISETSDGVSPALLSLEGGIFSPLKKKYTEEIPECIAVYSAANKADECDFVAMSVKKLMREKGVRCRDIIVYQREKGGYDSELVSAFRRYGVPFFEDRRQPVDAQPLMVFVSSLMELVCNGITTESLMRYLKTGLSPLSEDEIDELENYAFTWNIKTSQWKNEFTDNPRGFGKELKDSDRNTLRNLNSCRKKAIEPIIEFKRDFTAAKYEEKATVLYDFLKNNSTAKRLKELSMVLADGADLALFEEQDAVWSLLTEILDKLYVACKTNNVSPKRFCELFNMLVSVSDLGTLPQGLDDVTLALADRTRAGLKKYVFIIGANDGVFPKAPSSEGLLNDSERIKLRLAGIELAETAQYKGVEEEYIAYNTVCSATEGLFVTFSRSDYRGTEMSESQTVTEIKAIFPKIRINNPDDLSPVERIESGASAFGEFAKGYSSKTGFNASLREFFNSDSLYEGRVRTLVNAAEKRTKQISDSIVATELFGNDIILSATKVDTYKKCPFRFFCEFGLKASPRSEAKIDYSVKGTIFHNVFETLLKKYSKTQLEELDDETLASEISAALEEYLNRYMGGSESRTKRFLVGYRALAEELLVVFKRICEEFRCCEFEPVKLELSIGMGSKDGIAPYTLKLSDGGTIMLNGKVDRVDVMKTDNGNYFRIIDYKTSGKSFSLVDVLNGFNLQMLIYLFAIYTNGSEALGGDFVPSGVFYMPANTAEPDLGRDADDSQITEKQLHSNQMTGIAIDDITVLEGMERDLNGYFIPVSRDEDGTLKGSFISLKALMKLKEKVDETLTDIAEKLHRGEIPALPLESACSYCDFKPVCGFEDGDDVLQLTEYTDEDVRRILEEDSDGEGEENG